MHHLYVNLFWVLLLLTFPASLKWGGTVERMVVAVYTAAVLLVVAVRSPHAQRYAGIEYGVLVVDLCFLGFMVWVVARKGRWWLIWMTAFELIATLAHLARAIDPNFSRLAYSLMLGIAGYPSLILMAVGIALHDREATPTTDT